MDVCRGGSSSSAEKTKIGNTKRRSKNNKRGKPDATAAVNAKICCTDVVGVSIKTHTTIPVLVV